MSKGPKAQLLSPALDIPAKPDRPGPPPHFVRSDTVAIMAGGPVMLLAMTPEFKGALAEEARRHQMMEWEVVSAALLLVVRKGLDALHAVPDRADGASPFASGRIRDQHEVVTMTRRRWALA
jgi:hypothetical protein